MYLDYFVNTTSPMYNFDVDSEHEDHSEELLLFVGCIVNFIVSYLICMFQDSVPAGSYNDPFLSSVCVCVCQDTFVFIYIYDYTCMYIYIYIHIHVYQKKQQVLFEPQEVKLHDQPVDLRYHGVY